MNVSALKSMRSHWPQVMAALLRIREAYLARFPAARSGLTLGDIERLSTLVLAVPAYQLARSHGRVENGQLHPVLSSMFRVTDGLRTTTHQMLSVPVAEATMTPDTPVSAGEIHAYAERNYAFHSAPGVCAGPSIMIDQFLGVLLEGGDADKFASVLLDDEVEHALADMDAAFDYGLYALQAFAVVFSMWPLMTRTYDRMAAITRNWRGVRTPTLERLDAYLHEKTDVLHNETFHATGEWRVNRERAYADIYAQCAAALGDPVRQSLGERLAAAGIAGERATAERLRDLLLRRCGDEHGSDAVGVEWLVDCLMHSFVRTQQILALACEVQQRINQLLGREQPRREFSAADADIHVLLQGDERRRLPHLLDGLQEMLGLRVDITRHGVAIEDAFQA